MRTRPTHIPNIKRVPSEFGMSLLYTKLYIAQISPLSMHSFDGEWYFVCMFFSSLLDIKWLLLFICHYFELNQLEAYFCHLLYSWIRPWRWYFCRYLLVFHHSPDHAAIYENVFPFYFISFSNYLTKTYSFSFRSNEKTMTPSEKNCIMMTVLFIKFLDVSTLCVKEWKRKNV